jgi:transcriptional regulator with XRE-family HTH domain
MPRVRTNLPPAVRSLRRRRGWRQSDLAERSGLSRDIVSRVELGQLDGVTLRSVEALARSLGATLAVDLRWRGADLDRLIDRAHARIQAAVVRRLREAGWITHVEVAFNHYGDRGSCDVVAWDARTSMILVVEVKSRIGNLQDTLRRLDVKARLGSVLAAQVGVERPASIVRALVMTDERSTRRVLVSHDALFGAFRLRGRAALQWIRRPAGVPWACFGSRKRQIHLTAARNAGDPLPSGSVQVHSRICSQIRPFSRRVRTSHEFAGFEADGEAARVLCGDYSPRNSRTRFWKW